MNRNDYKHTILDYYNGDLMETNVLHCGDNLVIMRDMEDESIDLIYADPPFNTNRDWGEFDDRFRDMDHYIGWMSERIVEMRRLLKPTGSLYLHCDAHASHYLKVAMDNIFGVKNFNSDIIWRRCGSKGNAKMYGNSVDNILFYSKKRKDAIFNKQYTPYSEKTLKMFKHNDNDGNGSYKFSDVTAPIDCAADADVPQSIIDKYPLVDDIGRYHLRTFLRSKSMGERPNLVYEYNGFTPDKYGWRMIKDKVTALDKEGNLHWNSNGKPYRKIRPDSEDVSLDDYASSPVGVPQNSTSGNFYDLGYGEKMPQNGYRWKEETMRQKIADGIVIIKPGLVPRQKRYTSDSPGVPLNNIWMDVEHIKSASYPTEKPPALLERIVLSSSNKGDIVLDPFCGSGTSLFAAHTLGRRYIGIDQNPRAIEISRSRLDVPVQQTL